MPPAPGRPDLAVPPPVVAWLRDQLGLAAGALVATIGAPAWVTVAVGTGGCRTVEVTTTGDRPGAGRRRASHLVALADAGIPLRTASLDAAVVGPFLRPDTAGAAVGEVARVVRTGGRVGVVRHASDTSVEWVRRALAIVRGAAGWDPGRGRDASIVDALAGGPGLGPVAAATVRYHRECGVDEAAERFVAATRLRLLPPDQQGVVVDALRDHLATHPQTRARRTLLVPYLVDGRWCERVPD